MKEIKVTIQYISFNKMWGVISKPVRAKCMEKQQKSNFLEKKFRNCK